MSVSAPADLLEGTARAMSDEIEHARLCFTLARRYGGREVGPGPMDTAGALDGSLDAVDVAELVIREACVGETLAAADAAGALAGATDDEVRAALERIAADELRHAALGWRFIAWVLEQTDATGRARIARAFAHATRASRHQLAASSSAPDDDDLVGHGVLSSGARAALMQRTLREVIDPLHQALLRDTRASRTPPQTPPPQQILT
jgi:hypothetical protein